MDYKINSRVLLTELIGTFSLVFVGGMATMQSEIGHLDLVGEAIANFLVLSFMVYFGIRFSGAHYNPAVTLSFLSTGKMKLTHALTYILAQISGSVFAGVFLLLLRTDEMQTTSKGGSTLGFPHVADGYSFPHAIILEGLLTFFLVFIIWAVAVDDTAPPHIYGFAIGGVVGFNILIGGPLTGAAMNPARVFGPALLTNDFEDHMVYWIGPILGSIVAGFLYLYMFMNSKIKH